MRLDVTSCVSIGENFHAVHGGGWGIDICQSSDHALMDSFLVSVLRYLSCLYSLAPCEVTVQ